MTKTEIEDIFDEGGILDKQLKSYEVREGQIEMAKIVASAYENNEVAIVEAGTGIGKSYAYLVPALYNAIENSDEKTIIATATINLQDQLYKKDIPQLFNILNKQCSVALAVGRGNFVCIKRSREKIEEDGLMAMDPTSPIGEFSRWLAETETGLLTEYNTYLPFERSDINSDGELCSNFKCPYRKDCFYFKNKEKCLNSRIVVTNHHLLFTDSKSRSENEIEYTEEAILPPFNRLIIDEAHNIEETATEFFSSSYCGYSVLKRIIKIIKASPGRRQNLIEIVGSYATQGISVDDTVETILDLKAEVEAFTKYLLTIFEKTNYEPVFVEVQHQQRLKTFVDFSDRLVKKAEAYAKSVDTLVKYCEVDDTEVQYKRELVTNTSRLYQEILVLKEFCDFSSWTNEIHWFTPEKKRGDIVDINVVISPLEVASSLVSLLFEHLDTLIFTSATLNLEDDFKFWGGRVGLPFPSKKTFVKQSFLSPFDYENRLMLLIPYDAPSAPNVFSGEDKEEIENYNNYMADTIYKSILSSDGGALVLFTSKKTMLDIKKLVSKKLEDTDIKLLTQGDYGKHQLLRNFIDDDNSVLFALNSFWEGIDAPGNTLRLVIIVKLPFYVPSHPIIKARSKELEKNNKSSFYSLSLPAATMKLKQGFGRLMRSTADYGVVLILDSRIKNKNYGKYMLRSLPPCYTPEVMSSSITDKIESFLYSEK